MPEREPTIITPDKDVMNVTQTKDFLARSGVQHLMLENWRAPKAVLFVLDESYRHGGYQNWLEHRVPTMARLHNVTFDSNLPQILNSQNSENPETVEFIIRSKGVVEYFVIQKQTGKVERVKCNDPMEKVYSVRLESLYHVPDKLFEKNK